MSDAVVSVASLAEINPRTERPKDPNVEVSFVPMADISESGRWTGRQTRRFQDVQAGYTAFRDGDVLFAKITPCMENGKGALVTGLASGLGFGSTEFHVLRAISGRCEPDFLAQVLTLPSLRLRAESFFTGSAGQRRVPERFFEHFFIPKYEPAEQRRIADLLSGLDAELEVAAETLVKLEKLRLGLLQEMLRRNPPSELIGNHFHLRSGSTPSRAREDYYSESGMPWVKTLDLNEAELITTDERLSDLALAACPVTVHPRGTVLVAMYGGWEQIGRTAVLGLEACTNQAITALRPKVDDSWEPGFVLMALQALRHKWRQFAVSTRKDPNITKSDIARFMLPHPPLRDQQEWGQRLEVLNSLIRAERDTIQKKKLQKSALLQILLSTDGQARK